MCECKCKCESKPVQLKVVKQCYDNSKPRLEYTEDEQGQIHGTYRMWHANEQLSEQSEWVNGARHGIRYEWHSNGQLWEQEEWINGLCHGIQYVWNNDGSLKYVEQYDHGNILVEVVFEQDNQRLKKPIIQIRAPNHANVGDALIEVIKVLQEKGIKFKIAKMDVLILST